MARVRRIDIGTLATPIRRSDGTLIAEARLTRTGVFVYRNADGTERREYRPDSSVFDPKSLASFKLVPLTNDHPPTMLTADNARQYSVGAVGQDVRRDGNTMVATIAVHDAATIRDMDGGKTQVSNGYDCELIDSPGVSPEGEHYDAIQTNIVGNHLAIVNNARAGKDAAVRMDAAVMVEGTEEKPRVDRNSKVDVMDLTQALAALAAANEKIGALTTRADTAEKSLADAKARADKSDAERDAAKETATKAEAARKDAMDGTDARVAARVDLVTRVTKVLGDKVTRTDGAEVATAKLGEREMKLAVIKHVTDADCDKSADGKPRSMDYIDARFDAACEQAVESADTFREAGEHIAALRTDGTHEDAETKKTDKARMDMLEANRNGWRDPSLVARPAAK